MKRSANWLANLILLAGSLAIVFSALADTTISTFDNFNLDGLFGSWSSAAIVSGSGSYSVTSSGYGSGFKTISPNIDATGETNIELTVTISGTGGAGAPVSGPIVSLVDADGTFYNYAWYGQTTGGHILVANLNNPTSRSADGSIPGLDLSKLAFFHLQDDPGAYQGQYTITFEHLRLTGAPRLAITSQSYNPNTHEFTLTWTSQPGRNYTILHSADLASPFSPLITDIASNGNSTTTTVTMPVENSGFLRIQQQ